MTPQRAKELLPVIAAFAEGNGIQYKPHGGTVWNDVGDPVWDDANFYRIKPEPPRPRAVWIREFDNGALSYSHWFQRPEAKDERWVKFVEVVE